MSLNVLINLHKSSLEHRKFEDVAVIGKLKNLEIFSFCGYDIAKLREEMG